MRSPRGERWLILVLFLAGGVAMTAWEPTREILIGPVWLAGSLAALVFYSVMVVKARRLDRLRRTGEAGMARATAVRPLNLVVHEMPRLELDLEVNSPSGARSLTKRILVPLEAKARLEAGDEFEVRVDPGSERLAFVWPETGGPSASWIARALGGPAQVDPAALRSEERFIAGSS